MTAYGQGITPKWYRDQGAKSFTKMGFASFMHRIFVELGMLPIHALNPFDLGLLANAEYVVNTTRNDLVWFYDFPSVETWYVRGVPYRPVFCMYVGSAASSPPANYGTVVGNTFFFHFMYRRADRVVRTDLFNRTRLHSNSWGNYGLGDFNEALNESTEFGITDTCYGTYKYLENWKHYAASSDVNRTGFLNVKNLHVILGKGGLTVMVGTGTSKTDCQDIFSFSIVFGGARIPGRARVPLSDPNLNLACPVFMMPHHAASGGYISGSEAVSGVSLSGVHPVASLLGVQHDLKIGFGNSTAALAGAWPGAVRAPLFNLENIERPIYPICASDTKSSPRTLPSGGSHILQPIVYSTQYTVTNVLDYVGPLDPTIRSEVTPPWADVWMVPKFRFGDRTAPYGEFVDPTTGLNWFVFLANGLNHMVATEVEGITKYVTAPFTSPISGSTLTFTDYYNLNAGFTWTTGNPHQAVFANQAVHTFVPTASTDEALCVGIADGNVFQTQFTAEPYFPVVGSYYTLQMELLWNSVSAQTPTSNSLVLEYLNDSNVWINVLTIYNTGNAAVPYNAYTAITEIVIPVYSSTNRIYFRLRSLYSTSAAGTKTCKVRGIRIREYAYGT